METPLVDTQRAPHTLRARFAILLLAAALGGGSGAGVVAATAGGSDSTTATIAAAAATPVSSTTATSLGVGEIYARTAAGVVEVEVSSASTTPFGGLQTSSAIGTGFVYDRAGDIVTNDHAVVGATAVTVKLSTGKTYAATVVGTNPSTDVAVIHIDAPASELHQLTLANSSTVAAGDTAVAIGDPFGLEGSVTSGIVSALGRTIDAPNGAKIGGAIQTDAAINHGNSGGPLLNDHAEVIGITTQIESTSGDNAGVGFAVSSNTVAASVSAILA